MRLRLIADQEEGIRRVRRGKGFSYHWPDGRPVRDPEVLERIKTLAVPPAWQEVWICRDEDGHIQATGTDDAGRKQYRYHDGWRRARDADKFDRLIELGHRLPRLRQEMQADLARPGLGRERVVAAVVRALETTFARIGSERYANNGTYGLASVRSRHVEVVGSRVDFAFPTKGGKEVELEVVDAEVASVVRACADLPGERLFAYIDDDGEIDAVRRDDVNDYLKRALGDGFSAKDLRTWGGTVLLAVELREAGMEGSRQEREKALRDAIAAVAEELGNTPDVCKHSYLHPAVAAAYLDGSLLDRAADAEAVEGLWPEESFTLAVLESYRPGPAS